MLLVLEQSSEHSKKSLAFRSGHGFKISDEQLGRAPVFFFFLHTWQRLPGGDDGPLRNYVDGFRVRLYLIRRQSSLRDESGS